MKIIILAAGKGQRLGTEGPKPLTKLTTGETILGRQIRLLSKAFDPNDFLLVVGYRKKVIEQAFPQIKNIENKDYALQNTSKSLLCALEGLDDNILWLNGDVVFREEIVSQLVEETRTAMLVNKGPVAEEEVKYRLSSDGSLAEVSKTVDNGVGEAIGINLLRREDLDLFQEELRACDPNDYFEKALEGLIQKGSKVWPVTIEVDDCVEVDFPEDLVRANQLLNRWAES